MIIPGWQLPKASFLSFYRMIIFTYSTIIHLIKKSLGHGFLRVVKSSLQGILGGLSINGKLFNTIELILINMLSD